MTDTLLVIGGCVLISLPFVGIAALLIRDAGLLVTVAAFALVGLVFGLIAIGVFLLQQGGVVR